MAFLRTCIATITFITYLCQTPGCKGKLHVGGKQQGLFRQSERVAFGLCLLYHWLRQMFMGGAPWWSLWKETLSSYFG